MLSRAIVRDMVATDEAASKIGYVTMGMTLAPMLGPLIGGFLDEHFGWQSTFVLTVLLGFLAFTVLFLDLGETNHARSRSMLAQVGAYPELFRSRRFWGYTAVAAFTSGMFFAFLGGGPYVATEMLGLTPSQYGLYFGVIPLGYMFGNFCSGRFSQRVGVNRMIAIGGGVAVLGVILALVLLGRSLFYLVAQVHIQFGSGDHPIALALGDHVALAFQCFKQGLGKGRVIAAVFLPQPQAAVRQHIDRLLVVGR